jgi:hypothetical protein
MDAVEPVEKKAKGGPKIPVEELVPVTYELQDCDPINDVTSDLTCAICLSTLYDPVQCNGGGHMYCRRCITPVAMKPKARCPVGGKSCRVLSMNTLTVVPAAVRNMLKAVQVGCPLKCGEWFGPFDAVQQHVLKCDLRTVQCGWCKLPMEFVFIDKHEELCKCKPATCDYCKKTMVVSFLDIHMTERCKQNPYRNVKCVCGESVIAMEHEQHMLSNSEKHVVLLNSQVKLLSRVLFAWKFMFVKKERQISSVFCFGGLCWRLRTDDIIGDTFGVYLCSVKTENVTQQLVTRCVSFKIRNTGYDTIRSEFASFRSDGTVLINGEWKNNSLGKKNVYNTQLNVEYSISCIIDIIN